MLAQKSTVVKENAQTLSLRTNLYKNKREKFDPSKALAKGNATPVTTQTGRISFGEHGVIWAGKLNGWSVLIDRKTDEWSTVMYDHNSPVCGLVGVILAALQSLEVIEEDATSEEINEVVETLLGTEVVFELPGLNEENLMELYEAVSENSYYVEGEIELSIGVKADGSLSIKGTWIGDFQIEKGKKQLVESNRVAIGRAFSQFAATQEQNADETKSRFKSALKSTRQKTLDRREAYAAKSKAAQSTQVSSTTTAGMESSIEESSLPPVC